MFGSEMFCKSCVIHIPPCRHQPCVQELCVIQIPPIKQNLDDLDRADLMYHGSISPKDLDLDNQMIYSDMCDVCNISIEAYTETDG